MKGIDAPDPHADRRPPVRSLSGPERALATGVFGAGLDLHAVTIRCAKFWALHPWWVTMAPDGHIWCHPNGFGWVADYALQPLGMQAHFIHEMVHVWQVQQAGSLVWRRPPFARYGYAIAPGKPFGDYGIEQQACIVADAFLLRAGRALAGKPGLETYRALIPFGSW